MQKWEYTIAILAQDRGAIEVLRSEKDNTRESLFFALKRLGDEGWELSLSVPVQTRAQDLLIFKRIAEE